MGRSKKKVRYGVVGLGWFAQAAVLPAFAHATENSELAALVTGDPFKAQELCDRYQVPAVSYDEFDKLAASGVLDAVYLVVPNSRHREFTERAARAGLHVLCEKPMADTAENCQAMIDVCQSKNVRLMIAYRLHFEEANLKAVEIVRSGRLGEPRLFESVFTQQIDRDNTRLDADLGGGPLMDIGIYCINAARNLFRAEPTAATACAVHGEDARFDEVPEAVSAILRFPKDRLASFTCGFGAAKVGRYEVIGTKGTLEMDPAYTFHGDLRQIITVGDDVERRVFRKRDQIAPEILYFSECVRNERDPEPSGVEGLIDVRIIEALRRAAETGRSVRLEGLNSESEDERPGLHQEVRRPPVNPPELVHAKAPGPK